MTAPLTDEQSVQQILTELVTDALQRYGQRLDLPTQHIAPLTKTAIDNAAEQIRQQERDRVEKIKTLLEQTTHYTECHGDHWPTSGAVEVAKEARAALE